MTRSLVIATYVLIGFGNSISQPQDFQDHPNVLLRNTAIQIATWPIDFGIVIGAMASAR